MPHLETEVFFHGVKGCSRGDAQSTRAAHIIRLQPEPRYGMVQVVGPLGWWDKWWDRLEDAWEGIGVSHRQSPPPHPKGGYRICRCRRLMLAGGGVS